MKKKLALLFLFIACIPIVVAMILSSNLVSKRMEALLHRQAVDGLMIADKAFERLVDENILKAKIIARLEDIRNAVVHENKLELIQELNIIRQDLNINFYEGIIEIYKTTSDRPLAMEPRVAEKQAALESVQAAFEDILHTSAQLVATGIKITSCVPLHHPSVSTPLAAVCISFFSSDKLADEIKKVSNTDIMLLSHFTNNQNLEMIGSSLMIEGKRYKPSLTRPQLENLLHTEMQIDDIPWEIEATRREVEGGEFMLVVAIPKNDLVSTIMSLKWMLYFIGFIAFLMALVMALIFSRREFLKPIETLVTAAEAIQTDRLDTELTLKTRTNDEFQVLSNTLENMRLRLKGKIDEVENANFKLDRQVTHLSIINRINQAIINNRGQEMLLAILSIIAHSMDAARSSIMLLDSRSQQLLLKNIHVRGEKKPSSQQYISLELGEGIAGYAAQSGESVICNAPQKDPRFKPYESEEMNERLTNLLCVPLQGDGQLLGVINVDNKTGGFDENDCNVLQHIAHQVAIAIQNQELYEQSITDGMTGLYIHRYFQAILATELKRAERYNMKVSLLMFDIDHFKKFNDTYGHQVGDRVIQKVAETLRENLREGIDIPARYGGEEFAVIMPETEIEGAYLVAERLRKSVEKSRLWHAAQELHVTISLGCAEFPTQATEKDTLIQAADDALYCSKERGRNCTSIYKKEIVNDGNC